MEIPEGLTDNGGLLGEDLKDSDISAAVSELTLVILRESSRLAREILCARHHTEEEYWIEDLDLALLQLQIMRGLDVVRRDLTGVVAFARRSGATWEQIGTACGITKQAAYDRWRGPVKTLEAAATWAQARAKLPVNPLDQYDTSFVMDGRPAGRPRRGT